jgi:hypothetical protein
MTQTTTQMCSKRVFVRSKLLGLLVDLIGIEPMTSSMPWKRAPSCATGPLVAGSNSPIVAAGGRFVKHLRLVGDGVILSAEAVYASSRCQRFGPAAALSILP